MWGDGSTTECSDRDMSRGGMEVARMDGANAVAEMCVRAYNPHHSSSSLCLCTYIHTYIHTYIYIYAYEDEDEEEEEG